MEEILNLPVGLASFESIRAGKMTYVDKTKLIGRLALTWGGKYFLARPRRFGKSLLVSTLCSLFRHGLRDFDGLAVSSFWKDKKYDVLRLDFSHAKNVDSMQEFHAKVASMFQDAFTEAGLQRLDEGAVKESPFATFSNFLAGRPVGSLVLLVDEYDAPIAENLGNPEICKSILNDLSGFYAKLKSYDGCLRFLFITGILRIQHASLFSVLNPVTDISFDPEFGTLLGYTKEEIEFYFGDALEHAQQVLDLDRKELMKELAEQYNGYCFDQAACTHVFSPWSVMRFLLKPGLGFENYWYESSGTPSLLRGYLQAHAIGQPEEYSACREISLTNLKSVVETDKLDPVILLAQTGYLSIKSIDDGDVVLGYPNSEVAQAMARLYSDSLLNGKTLGQIGVKHVSRMLSEGKVDAVVDVFNRIFAAIDYRDYPVHRESECRAIVQVLLLGAGLTPRIELHAYRGRSDLELRVLNRHWVFEFKLAKNETDENHLLEKACEQISAKDYGRSSGDVELLRVALVFSFEKRCFVRWKQC